jgi:hypothetical protein
MSHAALPDCPSCDAAQSLEAIRSQGGLIECTCSCCGKTCFVKDNVVVHPSPDKRDVSGVQMYGD